MKKYVYAALMLLSMIGIFIAIQFAFQYRPWMMQFLIVGLVLWIVGFAASGRIHD